MKTEGKKEVLKILVVIIFLIGIGYFSLNSISHKDDSYITINPTKRNITESIFIPGNIYPAKEIEIKSQLSGILDQIYVEIGQKVKAGTPIASIKLVPNTIDIERLESNVNLAQIEFDKKSLDYQRAKRLFKTNTISESEKGEFKRNFLLSEENLISAKNQLELLRKGRILSRNISNIVIASTAGTIIDLPLEIGASVIERNNYNPGNTVAVIAETNIYKFRTYVIESFLKHIELMDTVMLTFNAYDNLKVEARVTKISSKGNLENGIMKYLLDAEFSNTNDIPLLRSGYSSTAEIILNKKNNVLSIEEKNIIYKNDSSYVYILDNKKIKTIRNIMTGISDGVYTEISNGCDTDDKIILNHDKIN